MSHICQEAEAALDHESIFKEIMKSVPLPMSPLESLASSAVRTCAKVCASLIIVLTRGGSTARLVAKYRPFVPILSVAVPVMTTDHLTWTCSEESPAHHSLVVRYFMCANPISMIFLNGNVILPVHGYGPMGCVCSDTLLTLPFVFEVRFSADELSFAGV